MDLTGNYVCLGVSFGGIGSGNIPTPDVVPKGFLGCSGLLEVEIGFKC